MKKSKWIAALLATVMVIAMFSGCGESASVDVGTMTEEEIAKFEEGTGGLELPIDDKGTTITVLCDTDKDSNNSIVINELRRRTGLNVQLIQVPRSSIAERARVMVASRDEMPDIFSGAMTIAEVNDIAVQGAFEPINEHIDELPNFKRIFIDEAAELGTEKVMKSYPASDGNLYVFPGYDQQRDVNHGMLYRKDIFDKNNIPMWDSPDTFYEALKTLKSIYPDSTPMVSKTQVTIFNQIGQSWGLGAESPGINYNPDTNTWKYACTDPRYKEMLDFLKKLYDEGLLDPEFLTCTQAAWTSKMTQAESAFVTFDWIGRLEMFYEQAKSTVPEYDLRYANPIGPTQKVITLAKASGGPAIKKSDNSLLALKLEDYLLSENGAELMTCGVEGVTFNWNEDKTKAEYIGVEPSQYSDINIMEEKYGMYVSGLYKRFDRRSGYFNFTEKEQEAQDLMLNKEGGGFLPEPPEVTLTNEEQEIISEYDTDIRTAAEEFASKYILSSDQTGDQAWEAWLVQAEQLGTKNVEDVYNAAQARYDAQ